jgi:hypothetical protein
MRIASIKVRLVPFFLFLAVVLSTSLCYLAKDHHGKTNSPVKCPLTLVGEVKNISITNKDLASVVDFEVIMTLHFKNESSSPVLVYAGEDYPWLGGITLASSKEESLAKKYIYSSGGYLSYYWEYWNKIRLKLERKIPPKDLIRIIDPGEEWSFDKKFFLEIYTKKETWQTNEPWDVIKKIDPLWLRIEFEMWPSVMERDPYDPWFGRSLQRKWKEKGHGYLVMDHLLSEPIAISLVEKDK